MELPSNTHMRTYRYRKLFLLCSLTQPYDVGYAPIENGPSPPPSHDCSGVVGMTERQFEGIIDPNQYAMQLSEELVEKAKVAPERFEQLMEDDVDHTPYDVVYEENKLTLRKYTPEEVTQDTPIVLVYALINRPYILDMHPQTSVVKKLLQEGFEVYMVDFGEPSRLDQSLTFDDYANRYLHNSVEYALEDAGVDDAHLLGYCQGGTLSLIYTALHQDRVRSLGTLALAYNFDGGSGGMYEKWAEPLDIEMVGDTLGNYPADPMAVVFAMRNPVYTVLTRWIALFDQFENEQVMKMSSRMEQWAWDGVDIAGTWFTQFVRDIVQENQLANNEMYVGGEHVDLTTIDVPVVQVIGEDDGIAPPESIRPLEDAISSEDYTEFSRPVGHFGVSTSPPILEDLWPEVAQWFAERSDREDADEETVEKEETAEETEEEAAEEAEVAGENAVEEAMEAAENAEASAEEEEDDADKVAQ